MAFVLSFTRLLVACGKTSDTGSGNAPTSGGDCATNGTSVSIAGNHGHALTVSTADITAGVQKTYDITGSAGHSHSVTLTAADFTNLAANQGVSEVSTASGHTHSVTVNCV